MRPVRRDEDVDALELGVPPLHAHLHRLDLVVPELEVLLGAAAAANLLLPPREVGDRHALFSCEAAVLAEVDHVLAQLVALQVAEAPHLLLSIACEGDQHECQLSRAASFQRTNQVIHIHYRVTHLHGKNLLLTWI